MVDASTTCDDIYFAIHVYKEHMSRVGMREKIGARPYELDKSGNAYTIKFYPMKEGAKEPDRVLFSLTMTKKEFEGLASKIK